MLNSSKCWRGIVLGYLLLLPLGINAQSSWTIDHFASEIAIQLDGSVLIQETIAVDFGSLEKHGIYRDLPYFYQGEQGKVQTRISDVDVTFDGEPVEFDVTRNDANVRIKIGDPDRTISGKHVYAISYRVVGVLQGFGEVDELNWNVTGNDWEAPISVVTARITVPAKIVRAACYVGTYGSEDTCDTLDADDVAVTLHASALAPGAGVTVAVGYEPNVVPLLTVALPPTIEGVLLSPMTWAAGAVLFLVGAGWWIRQWYYYGRDRYWRRGLLPGEASDREGLAHPESIVPLGFRGSIAVEYEAPDTLRPAEIGVLLDEKADSLDVSATIVDLASRGFLEIAEVDKKWIFGSHDYIFSRTSKAPDGLREYEKELLKRLFDDGIEVRLSELKNTFYTDLAVVKNKLYDEVVQRGLFARRPDRVRTVYVAVSIGILVLGGLSFFVLIGALESADTYALWQYVLGGWALGMVGVGLVALAFSAYMPRKTGYGRELYQRALGYKMFVSGTEKYRAKFYENQSLFVDVLSYAIVFGVTDKLAKAFRDMGVTPPQPVWFHGLTPFNPAAFAGSMNDFSKSLSTALQSSPSKSSSGGGGFSGGGFGGGGGGSW